MSPWGKKIEKFLGPGWRVVASYGHVRDLPPSALGVDVDNGFTPTYEISKSKNKTVKFITDAAKKAEAIYLAADPDREGEAIAWHLQELLNAECPVYRVTGMPARFTFNQITKKATQAAFAAPRQLDIAMVDSQQTRRILDRLVGWKISPVLRLAFKESLSAGRVQSVAVRLVVEREQEIDQFTPSQSWSISATLATKEDEEFTAKLTALTSEQDKELDPKRLPEKRARQITEACNGNPYLILDITAKQSLSRPKAPFITSTLQQKASSQLKMKPKKTMEIAQKLYEGGHITYMRTDSPNVADEAVQAARSVIGEHFPQALPDTPPIYSAKGDAQEAHECIRPTEPALLPDKAPISGPALALYRLIWTRFIASQMKPITSDVVVATIAPSENNDALPYEFTAQGKTLVDPGWLVIKDQDDKDDKKDKDNTLPPLQANQVLRCTKVDANEKWTKPPSRYSEPKLIQALEKAGIGRPSTYASIIETIQERGYVSDTGKSLAATESGKAVTEFLVQQFPDLLNLDFTKQMEEDLDRIAAGEIKWQTLLEQFYSKLTKHLASTKQALIDSGILTPCPKCEGVIATGMPARLTLVGKFGEYQRCLNCSYKPNSATETGEKCPKCKKPLVERAGKHGKFVSCSGYPECTLKGIIINTDQVVQVALRRGKNAQNVRNRSSNERGNTVNLRVVERFQNANTDQAVPLRQERSAQNVKNRSSSERVRMVNSFHVLVIQNVSTGQVMPLRFVSPWGKKTGKKCPDCKKPLVEKKGRYGAFISCSGYPKCKYIQK